MTGWAPRSFLSVLVVVSASCVHNTQDAHRDASAIFVTGKAYLCGDERTIGRPAAGKTIRLVTDARVLVEDTVGPDGSYVLHPTQPLALTDPIYIEAGDRRYTLANDFASWLQDRLTYRFDVRFGCDSDGGTSATAPPAAEPEGATGHLPPLKLLPKD